jgi:ATP-dependent Clp protease ATP-binding subunit ClpC
MFTEAQSELQRIASLNRGAQASLVDELQRLADVAEWTQQFAPCTLGVRMVFLTAQTEAYHHHHHELGTQHLLLGLLDYTKGVSMQVLAHMNVDVHQMRFQLEEGLKQDAVLGKSIVPLSMHAQEALMHARNEQRLLTHNILETEHILLGLLLTEGDYTAHILLEYGVTITEARRHVHQLLGKGGNY